MSEHPILFSTPMVRAILAGTKTQTRRLITRLAGIGPVTEFRATTTPGYDFIMRDSRSLWNDFHEADVLARCPYGVPGDLLWVREAHAWADAFLDDYDRDPPCRVAYRADGAFTSAGCDPQTGAGTLTLLDVAHPNLAHPSLRWRPSIHMPKWAARLWLRVESVRIERVQEISGADVLAEGVGQPWNGRGIEAAGGMTDEHERDLRVVFSRLWDSINSERAPWSADPWVWVVGFSVASRDGRPTC